MSDFPPPPPPQTGRSRSQKVAVLVGVAVALVVIVAAVMRSEGEEAVPLPTAPPTTQAPTTTQAPQAQWTDADDAPPDYPTSATDQRDAWVAFDAMTTADQRGLCDKFWSDTDQVIFDELKSYDLTTSEANALLNVMWAWC